MKFTLIEWLISAAIVLLIPLAIWAGYIDHRQWEKYKVDHECHVVTHIPSRTYNTVGVGSNGSAVIGIATEPERSKWLCDDGVTHYH